MTPPSDPGAKQMQPARPSDMVLRLQIGIGGVLAVLLLVGLASIIGERAVDNAATEAAASGAAPPAAPTAEADQPLIDLGVQPADRAAAAPPAAAPATAPVQTVTDLPASPATAPPPKSTQ